MKSDQAALANWIGKTESRQETLTQHPMDAMAATLDRPAADRRSVLPPLWHWLYFLDTPRQSRLAADGHAERGDFLPPIALPRRMWAGSRIDFTDRLQIGDTVERTSVIRDIQHKQGRSGALAFVSVEHTLATSRGIALREEHDIVYRDHAAPGAVLPPPEPAPAQSDFSRTVTPSSVLLFRYSALTFNGHRIHYDREFAASTEGYPGLVVHGPLLATLMVDLLLASLPGCTLSRFEFKALRPVFDLAPFTVCVKSPDSANVAQLWVQDELGALCMRGSATLEKR